MSHNYLNATFSKSGMQMFVGGSSCVTVSYKMEKNCVTRQYHEKSGRLVRNDKVYTVEEEEERAKVRTDCKMEEDGPEGTVGIAALPTLERCVCQEANRGGGALAAAAAKTRGLMVPDCQCRW